MHQNRVLNHKDRTWTREWMFGVWVVKTVGGKSVIWSALNSRSTCLFIVSICDFIAPVGLGLKFYFKMASICLLFSSPGSAFIFNSYSFASCFFPSLSYFFSYVFLPISWSVLSARIGLSIIIVIFATKQTILLFWQALSCRLLTQCCDTHVQQYLSSILISSTRNWRRGIFNDKCLSEYKSRE